MTDQKTIYERTLILCKALCMTPTKNLRIEKDFKDGRWWLCGAVEGDSILPMTQGAHTIYEALDRTEGWLSPEIDKLEENVQNEKYCQFNEQAYD